MLQIRAQGKLFQVWLIDDGTLDTVIAAQPVAPKIRRRHDSENWPVQELRFDSEYAASYRRADGSLTLKGLRELGKEVAEEYLWEPD